MTRIARFLLLVAAFFSSPAFSQSLELSSYKLGSGDMISVRVLGEEDLKREKVRLSDAGTLSFPVLGEIRVKGMTVGAQKGTAYVEPLQKSGLFAEVKIYDNIPAILADVNAGRIQAGFADKPIVAYNLQQGAFAETRLVKGYVSTMTGSVGIGVRKGDAALLKRINTSLEKLQGNGSVDKILAKWGQ